MRFGGRTTVSWRSHRWAIALPGELSAAEHRASIHGAFAASMVDECCQDPMTWPDMLLLYEEITGERLRPPTSSDVEQRVIPRLRTAFGRGEILVVPMEMPWKLASQAERGIHGRQPELVPEAPLPPGPRQIARIVPEKTFLDVQILDTDDEPLAGRRFKLQLPDGRTETGRLGSDGRLRKTNIDPGTAYLSILNEEGPDVAAEDVAPKDASPELKQFSVRVVNVAGAPLAGLDLAFVSNGTRTVVQTDDDGVAQFEAPEDPAPSVEVADAEQMQQVIEQQSSAEGSYGS
jgi:hypothetical protein